MSNSRDKMREQAIRNRHDFAWWYACGRNDNRPADVGVGRPPYVDPNEFAAYCRDVAEAFYNVGGTLLPSIQDSWKEYTTK